LKPDSQRLDFAEKQVVAGWFEVGLALEGLMLI
jgi:hypothetical protein